MITSGLVLLNVNEALAFDGTETCLHPDLFLHNSSNNNIANSMNQSSLTTMSTPTAMNAGGSNSGSNAMNNEVMAGLTIPLPCPWWPQVWLPPTQQPTQWPLWQQPWNHLLLSFCWHLCKRIKVALQWQPQWAFQDLLHLQALPPQCSMPIIHIQILIIIIKTSIE